MKALLPKFGIVIVLTIAASACMKEPSVDFTFDNDNSTVPILVSFSNLSSDADTYLWDFGDGDVSTESNPHHMYASAGEMNVSLTATNKHKSATVTKTLTLLQPTTFSVLNSTTNLVLENVVSFYFDASQNSYIDQISLGTLYPSQRSGSVVTTYSSRTIFFYAGSSTLAKVKYPYSITPNVENVLVIDDATLFELSLVKNSQLRSTGKFLGSDENVSAGKLKVQLSGSQYQ
jgi:PKD repeat protein